jgi:hypothetical protein
MLLFSVYRRDASCAIKRSGPLLLNPLAHKTKDEIDQRIHRAVCFSMPSAIKSTIKKDSAFTASGSTLTPVSHA